MSRLTPPVRPAGGDVEKWNVIGISGERFGEKAQKQKRNNTAGCFWAMGKSRGGHDAEKNEQKRIDGKYVPKADIQSGTVHGHSHVKDRGDGGGTTTAQRSRIGPRRFWGGRRAICAGRRDGDSVRQAGF